MCVLPHQVASSHRNPQRYSDRLGFRFVAWDGQGRPHELWLIAHVCGFIQTEYTPW